MMPLNEVHIGNELCNFFYLVGISNYFSLGYVVKIFLCYKLHCT